MLDRSKGDDATGPVPAFLDSGGETGALIAARDWSATSLGPIDSWPQSLRTALALLLRSPVPIVMLWGEDGIMLYNDAYSEFAGGRHPEILGAKVREGWPEVADFNDHIMNVVLAGGTLRYENQELMLNRNGRPEPVWMNLDYSPVIDESGRPAGVIVIVVETTQAVLRDRALRASEARLRFLDELGMATAALSEADAILATTTRMTGEHMRVSNCAYADMDPDEDGFTIRGDWSAPGSPSIVGHYSLADFGKFAVKNLSAGLPLVVNDNLTELEPHEAATFQSIGIGATICMPLVKDGRLTALMAIHDKNPRVWTAEELALIKEVTERSWAHIERAGTEADLRESEERMRMALVAGGFSDWYWTRETDRIRFSPRAAANFRLPPDFEPSSAEIAAFVPEEDRAIVLAAGEQALATGEPYEIECRMARPDGSVMWIATYGQPVRGEDGAVVGVIGISQEITNRKRSEEALKEREEQLTAFISQTTAGFAQVDLTGIFTLVNDRFCEIAGRSREELMSLRMQDITHPEDLPDNVPLFEAAVRDGAPYTLEKRYIRPDGSIVWVNNSVAVIRRATGEPWGVLAVTLDVTERKRAEQHQTLLVNELNHRVKNTLAIVQAIAQQSFRGEAATPAARKGFEGRLAALSAAHNLLTRQNWQSASLHQVLEDGLAPYDARSQVRIDGPDLELPPKTAVSLAMAIHELATNAVKYGALSNAEGRVSLCWQTEGGRLRLRWAEEDGPPVREPGGRGFGTRMIERGLAAELGGEARIDFAPGGIVCTVDAPLPDAADHAV